MKRLCSFLFLVILGVAVSAQDKPAGGSTPVELYGTWTGTWEGGGGPGGGFELTLGKGQGEGHRRERLGHGRADVSGDHPHDRVRRQEDDRGL